MYEVRHGERALWHWVVLAAQRRALLARNARHSGGVGWEAGQLFLSLFFIFIFFHFFSYHAGFRLHRNEMCVVYLTLEIVKGKAVPAMFPFCFCRVFFKSVIKDLYT